MTNLEMEQTRKFSDFDLDDRIVRALNKMGFDEPTLIQEKSLQFALEGKDLIARAITGSGKTLAFCIPLLNRILMAKKIGGSGGGGDQEVKSGVKSCILVPSRELAQQVCDVLRLLCQYCSKSVSVLNLSANNDKIDAAGLSFMLPDIIISTPSRLNQYLKKLSNTATAIFDAKTFQSVAIDEADLLLSFGYEEDVSAIISMLPRSFQGFLMSATLSDDVLQLSKMFLRNPVTIKLEEGVDECNQLTEYCIRCKDDDRFLILFFILKLKLVKGKCLIFVEDIQKCYRVKLFLEQFSIKSCVLNSELPYNSRYHIVQEFNRGIYQYIIATDESVGGADASLKKKSIKHNSKNKNGGEVAANEGFGVARGIDFVGVAAVLNFDFPKSSKSYIHRIGRTARGKSSGMAISFVTDSDRRVYSKVEYKRQKAESKITPYEFDQKNLDSFRYRCEDALRSVTKAAVNDARLKELKVEVLNSEKLKTHFAQNPNDLQALRHDSQLSKRVQPHLKHIPDYLLPKEIRGKTAKVPANQITKRKMRKRRTVVNARKKQKNPLKSLTYNG